MVFLVPVVFAVLLMFVAVLDWRPDAGEVYSSEAVYL